MSRIDLINYGRWYYDHASTHLPVMTTEDGRREYPDRLLRQGHEVCIRNATAAEHASMAVRFDYVVDDMAYKPFPYQGTGRFVSGLGNFDEGDLPKATVDEAVANLKAAARVEPMKETP